MAGPNYVLDKGYQAAAAVTQFQAVKLASDRSVTPCTVLGEEAWGISQEEVAAGSVDIGKRIIDIRLKGISRCIAGATNIAVGTWVRVNASGQVVPLAAATAAQNALGRTTTASTAVGDYIDVDILPQQRDT